MKLNSRLKTKDKIEKNNKRQTENDVNLHNKQAQIIENSLKFYIAVYYILLATLSVNHLVAEDVSG